MTGKQRHGDGQVADRRDVLVVCREVVRVSLPLMLGMAGNLVLMLTDRISLARFSPDTLEASGPAVFTAMTLVMFLTGTVGITRSYVAQAHGRGDDSAALDEAVTGTVLALLLAVLLLASTPLLERVPEVAGQPHDIQALESVFLGLSTSFGAVMTLNVALSSYFNGVGRTRVPMAIGLVGQAIGILMTIGLVFGRFGLPRMGMRGSALGTLAAVSVMFAGYLVCLPRGFLGRFLWFVRQGPAAIARTLRLRLRRGGPSGGAAGLDETAQTLFVWFAGALGSVALGADNAVLSVNYLAVIPLLGLGTGCGILCGHAVGSRQWGSLRSIVRATLLIEGFYVGVICLLQVLLPSVLLAPFGLNRAGSQTVVSAVDTVRVLWTYAVAFMFSVVAAAVLECLGLARFAFVTRLLVTWAVAIPLICWITLAHRGDSRLLPVIWVLFSLAEVVIAVLCFGRIRRAASGRENQLIADDNVAEPVLLEPISTGTKTGSK